MPYILRTAYLIPDEALPRKGFQLLRTLQTVLDNKTRHLSATHLGIDNDSLRLSGLPNLKLGRNNTHLLLTRFQSNKSFISALAKLMRTPPQFLISSMK